MKAKLFVSYSHADDVIVKQFVKFLNMLKITGKADVWTDAALEAGTTWDPTIKAALEEANIILILITINPLCSTYVRDVEMKRAYEKYLDGSARVICVIMEECPWEQFPTGIKQADGSDYLLKHFQAVKPFGQPIYAASQSSLAAAMTEAYHMIDRSIDDFLRGKP